MTEILFNLCWRLKTSDDRKRNFRPEKENHKDTWYDDINSKCRLLEEDTSFIYAIAKVTGCIEPITTRNRTSIVEESSLVHDLLDIAYVSVDIVGILNRASEFKIQ